MMEASFYVTSYNEAEALGRMVRSTLPLASRISEWVIVDHRSDDHTPLVIEGLRPILYEKGIELRTWREGRDFSPSFTFADLRNSCIEKCREKIIVQADADFIFGPGFVEMFDAGAASLSPPDSPFDVATYAVPVIWDRLNVGRGGKIQDHGRIWIHKRKPNILHKDRVRFRQVGGDGHWEVTRRLDGGKRKNRHLTKKTRPRESALISVNVKSNERLDLRHTMTCFMQDVTHGKVEGEWLENYRRGNVRYRGPYKYVDVNLRGWRIFSPPMELNSESKD